MSRGRFSLNLAVLSSLSIVLLLTWILIGTIVFKTSQSDRYRQKGETCRFLVSFLTRTVAPSWRNAEAIRAAAAPLAAEKNFAGLCIVGTDGHALFCDPAAEVPDERMLNVLKGEGGKTPLRYTEDAVYAYAPVVVDGGVAGVARLGLSLRPEKERLQEFAALFSSYFILDSLLLLVVGGFLMSRLVLGPVNRVVAATRRIAEGDLGGRVPVGGATEVAELAESFNAMIEALRRKQREVELYVISVEEASRRLEAAREETLRSEKLASVGLLAAGTAHEIGSPLGAIIGYADLLDQEVTDPENRDYVRRISSEARRIDGIVRGLLDYARPAPPLMEDVPIPLLLAEVVDMMKAQGVLKKIDVRLDAEEGTSAVHVDRSQMLQVFVNLILNARDAMPEGGALYIAVHEGLSGNAKASKRGVTVRFSDTGTGIPPGDIGKIFDPFFTTKEPGKGTGLGLSICARIVESFGGAIAAESPSGAGAVFTITLPAAATTAGEKP